MRKEKLNCPKLQYRNLLNLFQLSFENGKKIIIKILIERKTNLTRKFTFIFIQFRFHLKISVNRRILFAEGEIQCHEKSFLGSVHKLRNVNKERCHSYI